MKTTKLNAHRYLMVITSCYPVQFITLEVIINKINNPLKFKRNV